MFVPMVETLIPNYIKEGKYHEIKYIFRALQNKVVKLKRLRMKNLVLDESLKEGEYRPLTQEEIDDLKSINNE